MSEKFLDSFSLWNADHRLVDWDAGFAQELQFSGVTLEPGLRYADFLHTVACNPFARQFVAEHADFSSIETLVEERSAGFGGNRRSEYRRGNGSILEIDERPTIGGGIRRLTRDVTDERKAGTALLKADRRQDAEDSQQDSAATEIRRNPDGSYAFPPITEAVQRLLDFPPDFVGQDAMLIQTRMPASPEQNARLGAAMEHSAETLEICSIEYRLRDGKNRLRWIRESMMPRREPDGTVVFSGVMRDITREKDAEDQVELLRSVVVRSSDSIGVFETVVSPERGTTILYVNARFVELFGWSEEALVGQPVAILRPREYDGVGASLILAAVGRDDGLPFEYEAVGKGGRRFWVEVRVMTVQKLENGGFRWVVISRDVGERRHAQDELLRAKEAAEAGNLAKGQFLTNMSHELRTPLNAIIGFTELIERGVERTGWVPSYTEYLADVSASGRHLLDLINTILDLSKIDSGQLELDIDAVDLCELTRTSLALVSGMARDGKITISTDIPVDHPDIPGDYLKLKQVLLNIFSNAIKFTPADGKISIALRFTKAKAVITVTDTGCGIPGCDIERVMLPFVQVGNTLSRKYGGSGLGLSIARELCVLHGGMLRIASVEGQGTTVRISLPVSVRPAMPIRHRIASASGSRQPGAAANRGDVVEMRSGLMSATAA
jgi:PAS domain S-box-containing protein